MKKILSIVLSLVIIMGVFAGCSGKTDDPKETTKAKETTATTEVTTDEAVVKEADAIELIKSYSAKELGLSKDDYKKCSFMVGGEGIKIDKAYYIKVIAAIKNSQKDKDGKEVYTFDVKGEYFISYDGKKVLKRDLKSTEDKYDELEVKEVPTKEQTTKAESTTKK